MATCCFPIKGGKDDNKAKGHAAIVKLQDNEGLWQLKQGNKVSLWVAETKETLLTIATVYLELVFFCFWDLFSGVYYLSALCEKNLRKQQDLI